MNRLMSMLMPALLVLLALPSHAQNPNAQKEWEQTVAAAKKEGKVVVTGPPDAQMRTALPAAFKARYGITLEYLGGRSNEVAARLRSERGAGVYTVDVMIAGAQTMANILYPEKMLDPLRPALVLPEVLDGSKWKTGKLWFMDPEQQYVLRLVDSAITLLHINTRVTKMEELRSSRDLLDPKWKGKIAMMDPTVPGSGISTAAQLYAQVGPEFVKRLYVDQKPVLTRDKRQLTDWLIRGTYPIVFDADDEPLEQLRKDGEPLVAFYGLPDLPPASTSGVGMLALINKAPHPNAAKVFVNWMASKEGLEIYARTRALSPTRSDIDEKSFLPPQMITQPGVKYFDTHGWELTQTTTEKLRLWLKDLLGR
jgi:iron(III) transport system substrate-binding protein